MPPPSLEGAQFDPRKTKVVKTSESRFSANSSKGKQTLQKKEDNSCDFTPPQPVCFSFRFSCSLPAARLLQLNQTSSVFTGLRTRLKGFSITK
ncbi:hypothetical protein TNCT_497431 [Trichonephila clavata]|uniref:Uncharacterized protein n=1 Tax=Trichonephila clavata TaxID=2740835 RepID=A0A8X6K7D0_TRICU|nr:hypothetical protein TNCT_497431 [Trichonephila clavata]